MKPLDVQLPKRILGAFMMFNVTF